MDSNSRLMDMSAIGRTTTSQTESLRFLLEEDTLFQKIRSFLLGKVDNLWIFASSNSLDRNLVNLGKERLLHRKIPEVDTFDEYVQMRNSCWLVEERAQDFFCDCYISMKGKICKHTGKQVFFVLLLDLQSIIFSGPFVQNWEAFGYFGGEI